MPPPPTPTFGPPFGSPSSPTGSPTGSSTTRPLIVTDDEHLLEELLRLAAAAGAEPFVAPGPATARASWTVAPLVVVGDDAAEALARARLPRRTDVVLVGCDLDDAGIWRRAVDIGAEHVALLPDAEPWLVGAFADAREGRPTEGRLVAVVGGRGGAGATTLAAALAVTAQRTGRRALLIDADPLGGGIDLVVGGEHAAGLRWRHLVGTRGRVPVDALHEALPCVDDLAVLSWDRNDEAGSEVPPDAMAALVDAGIRGTDVVVVDLPRRLDAAAQVALELATVGLLVVPAELRAAAAASRVAVAVSAHCADLRVVVRGPAPSGLSARDVADSLALPLAGELRAEPGLAAALERGEPPAGRGRGPLATLCGTLLDELVPLPGRAVA